MDCRTARLLLEFARPQSTELEAADAEALEGHLAGCPDCDGTARVERRLDNQLASAMCGVPVPDGLRERIFHRLDSERNAVHARWLRRFATAAAAVAAVFVGAWFVIAQDRPTHLNVDDYRGVRDYAYAQRSPEQVETWYREQHHLKVVAPRQFDYQWLCSSGLTAINQRQVPELIFVKPRDGSFPLEAHVLIFPKKDFQLENAEASASSGGGFRFRRLPCEGHEKEFEYLALYTSDTLDEFFPPPPKQPAGAGARADGLGGAVGLAVVAQPTLSLR